MTVRRRKQNLCLCKFLDVSSPTGYHRLKLGRMCDNSTTSTVRYNTWLFKSRCQFWWLKPFAK